MYAFFASNYTTLTFSDQFNQSDIASYKQYAIVSAGFKIEWHGRE